MEVETITAPDAEEAGMRELGIQADSQEGRPTDTAPETPQAAPESPEPTQAEAQPETEQPESPQPELTQEQQLGRDIKTGQFKKAERPETDYSRAQKEEARKDRSWQALQAEKEQFRQYASQWEEQQRMAQLEAQRQQYQPLKKEGLTAQQYYQGAQRFEQEGDYENAVKAYKVASEMGHQEQQRYSQFQEMNAEYEWRKQMQEVGQQYPQVWQEPIAGHLQRIIAQNDWLYRVPDGFKRAAEVAHMLVQQGSMKEMQDEIVSLKAQLEKYNRKGQPAKGGYAAPRTGEKDFDSMDLNEMESHLKHLTSEADSWR